MTESEILDGLHQLGIGAANSRLVMLLPLVQVAWADNEIQAPEREHILNLASQAKLLDEEGFHLLVGWLNTRPSDADLALARRILVSLAHRTDGLGSEVHPVDLGRVVDLCQEVARAAGGLFGIAFTVSPEEKEALATIDAALESANADYFDLLPTSSTGTLEDL